MLREVGHFERLLGGLALDQPHQSRLGDQVWRELRKCQAPGVAERDFLANLQDWALRDGQQLGLDHVLFAGRFMVAVGAHVAADVLFEQRLRREQIEAIVLLQHAQRVRAERLDRDRLRLNRRGHVAKLERDAPRAELGQLAHLTYEREVRVVDGEAHLFAIAFVGDALRRNCQRRPGEPK